MRRIRVSTIFQRLSSLGGAGLLYRAGIPTLRCDGRMEHSGRDAHHRPGAPTRVCPGHPTRTVGDVLGPSVPSPGAAPAWPGGRPVPGPGTIGPAPAIVWRP